MSLSLLSGREVARILSTVGYELDHQRGSHLVHRQSNSPHRRVTVPDHREAARGTLRQILKDTGLTEQEFRALV